MEQIIKFIPAFDKRDPDPKKNYGIHGVNMIACLKGELGAMTFTLFTNWMLPSVEEEALNDPRSIAYIRKEPFTYVMKPQPADVSYHSPKPMHEGDIPVGLQKVYDDDYENVIDVKGEAHKCEWIGCACYSDGSALDADNLYRALLEGGSEAMFAELEIRYKAHFGELK